MQRSQAVPSRTEDRLAERSIRIELQPELPLLFIDTVLFEQVFVNLLENAAKYTAPGTPLEIHAARRQERIWIQLLDHGPGLPEGDEEKLFEKFYRGPHNRSC